MCMLPVIRSSTTIVVLGTTNNFSTNPPITLMRWLACYNLTKTSQQFSGIPTQKTVAQINKQDTGIIQCIVL